MVVTEKEILRFYTVIGENIREAREHAGFNQSEFATLLELSRASIVNIEKGRQHAPLHVLWEISKQAKTQLSALLLNTEQQNVSDAEMSSVEKQVSELLKDDVDFSKDKVAQFLKENLAHHGI